MAIVVDEHVPRKTVTSLQHAGHEVLDVRSTEAQGSTDEELWNFCQLHHGLLITSDRYFESRRFDDHFGILVIRLSSPNRARLHDRIMEMLDRIPEHEWPGLLVVARNAAVSLWRKS